MARMLILQFAFGVNCLMLFNKGISIHAQKVAINI